MALSLCHLALERRVPRPAGDGVVAGVCRLALSTLTERHSVVIFLPYPRLRLKTALPSPNALHYARQEVETAIGRQRRGYTCCRGCLLTSPTRSHHSKASSSVKPSPNPYPSCTIYNRCPAAALINSNCVFQVSDDEPMPTAEEAVANVAAAAAAAEASSKIPAENNGQRAPEAGAPTDVGRPLGGRVDRLSHGERGYQNRECCSEAGSACECATCFCMCELVTH